MTPVKIVIIGGGSYAWGPLFIRDVALTPALDGSAIVLQDINPQALDLVYALGQKIIQAGDTELTLHKTTRLPDALPGADFVILTITTGGLQAMRHDLEIPEKYGIYHTVGDTVGPGGLARALRNIPVVLDIARQIEAACPDAWLLNYTNPMTTLCRAVTRETRVKTIGLCHEVQGVRRQLQEIFGVDDEDIQARVAGINHLAWMLDLKIRGQDAMPQLRELAAQLIAAGGAEFGPRDRSSMIDRALAKSRLLQIYGALPAAGDRHVAEFFPFFLSAEAQQGQKYGLERTSVQERQQWRDSDERFLHSLLNDEAELAAFMQHTSGEASNELIAALAAHKSYSDIMNLPNQGQIANLPPGVIVETQGIVDASGARGLCAGELPPGIHAIIARHVANQEMTVQAALTGDKNLALQVLLNDPLVHDLDSAAPMLDEMLAANHLSLTQIRSTA